MNSKLWIRKAITSCLMAVLLATYSMVALANEGRATGQISISGLGAAGDTSVVTVNGETARSGRTVFSSSTISTPDGTTASVNMGKAGEIELAANTTLTLSFDNASANVDLMSGTLTVLNASKDVNVNVSGSAVTLKAGESASASGSKTDKDYRDSTGKCIDANKNGKEECGSAGGLWWVWALVFGGAAAGIIIGATRSNTNNLGGSGTVISPTR